MKICNSCSIEKPNKSFSVNNARPDNLSNKCKPCLSEQRKLAYARNPEAHRRKWKRNKYSKPEHAEDRRLRAAYGITREIKRFLSQKQNDVCLICSSVVKLVVDHDHQTGVVRGLLCNKCNLGLGGFNDNPELLSKALEYLTDFNEKQATDFN